MKKVPIHLIWKYSNFWHLWKRFWINGEHKKKESERALDQSFQIKWMFFPKKNLLQSLKVICGLYDLKESSKYPVNTLQWNNFIHYTQGKLFFFTGVHLCENLPLSSSFPVCSVSLGWHSSDLLSTAAFTASSRSCALCHHVCEWNSAAARNKTTIVSRPVSSNVCLMIFMMEKNWPYSQG